MNGWKIHYLVRWFPYEHIHSLRGFSSHVWWHQGVIPIKSHGKSPFSYGFPMVFLEITRVQSCWERSTSESQQQIFHEDPEIRVDPPLNGKQLYNYTYNELENPPEFAGANHGKSPEFSREIHGQSPVFDGKIHYFDWAMASSLRTVTFITISGRSV